MGEHRKQKKSLSQTSETTAVSPVRKLLISHLVCLSRQTDLVEIQRGDVVFAQDGVEAGVVAAIMVDCHRQEATHFLLGFVPPTAIYHLVSLSLIDWIRERTVWLKITSEEINDLPRHQPDG
ncbi:MAG: hypothetical protein R3E31_02995 [Chloroflexota bacterium]|mgnify:CR=1 FL=1